MPDGAERAEVAEIVDGDTIVVRLDGGLFTVDLMGIDAPDGEGSDGVDDCFAEESTDRLGGLLAPGREVWLEQPQEVNVAEDPASRYVWAVNGDGDPYMINRSMVRHGFAISVPVESGNQSVNVRRLVAAEANAVADGVGLWEVCGLLEPTAELIAIITDCATFGSFGDAQTYYAARPDAQPFIDPNFDGRACEVWFGIDLPPSAGVPPAPAPGPGPPLSGQGRDGADGAPGRDGNDVRTGDSVGEPGNDSDA